MTNHPMRFQFHRPLFHDFDPFETCSGDTWDLRDSKREAITDDERSPELLVLVYMAMCVVGQGEFPTAVRWQATCDMAKSVVEEESLSFDFRHFANAVEDRALLKRESTSLGSPPIMFLGAALTLKKKELKTQDRHALQAILCLLWIHEAFYVPLDEMSTINCVLRASTILSEARPPVSAAEARRELASRAARAKHANDPKQLEKLKVKASWFGLRNEPLFRDDQSALAIELMRRHPMFINDEVVKKWMRLWARDESF